MSVIPEWELMRDIANYVTTTHLPTIDPAEQKSYTFFWNVEEWLEYHAVEEINPTYYLTAQKMLRDFRTKPKPKVVTRTLTEEEWLIADDIFYEWWVIWSYSNWLVNNPEMWVDDEGHAVFWRLIRELRDHATTPALGHSEVSQKMLNDYAAGAAPQIPWLWLLAIPVVVGGIIYWLIKRRR